MRAWQLTIDSLREFDFDGQRERRIEGIAPSTEAEAPNGSWHNYLQASPLQPGEQVLIVWPYPGRTPGTQRVTRTCATIAVMDRLPEGPWGWAVEAVEGDTEGRTIATLTLDGEPVAASHDLSTAFALAHLLNAAEDMRDRADHDRAIAVSDLDGIPAPVLVVATSPIAIVTAGEEAARRITELLSRWTGQPEVLAGLAATAHGAGGWTFAPAWTFADPMVARAAVVAGGLSSASIGLLDTAGLEAWRQAARLCSLLGEAIPSWREVVMVVDTHSRTDGKTVIALIGAGRVDDAERLASELLRTALRAGMH